MEGDLEGSEIAPAGAGQHFTEIRCDTCLDDILECVQDMPVLPPPDLRACLQRRRRCLVQTTGDTPAKSAKLTNRRTSSSS